MAEQNENNEVTQTSERTKIHYLHIFLMSKIYYNLLIKSLIGREKMQEAITFYDDDGITYYIREYQKKSRISQAPH